MILSIRVFDYDVLISSGLIETLYRRANDYESVRKYWKLSRDKADKVKYILGIYRGIVRIVIDVKGNSLCSVADDGTVFKKPRFAFVGDIVPDSPYLNTDVTDYPFGSGGAITYIPRTNFLHTL